MARIAYLSSEYPCVSHTFVRREIVGLERRGYSVVRFAIRKGEVIVDSADADEAIKTLSILGRSLFSLALLTLHGLFHAGSKVLTGISRMVRLSRRSERGLLTHVAYLLEALALIRLASQQGVDHIHVHFGNNAAALALLAKTMGGPTYSMTVHGPDEFDAPHGFSLSDKIGAAEFVVAISSYCSAQIKRWAPYRSWDKVHIVHCTVDDNWFDASRPVGDDCQNIVCVGRLVANKGQAILVEAFAKACKRGFPGKLVLVGDGEMRGVIEEAVASSGLGDRVELRGWLASDQIMEVVLNCKAMIMPSFAEGLPVVIMESMALGRPVVATRITGIPELVTDGVTGWLVTAGDVEELIEALMDLSARSPAVMNTMGERARSAVMSRHSTDSEIRKLSALFDQYLDGVDSDVVTHRNPEY